MLMLNDIIKVYYKIIRGMTQFINTWYFLFVVTDS